MSESIITDVYAGKFVLIQLVDTTVELTVENNIYSLSEALELEQDLQNALYILKRDHILKEDSTYSQEMQELLEPIDE
tara:strand:- start:255 stop:488 length:234 start_codon:yes stop_codon:yes gene_type:complete